MKWAILLVFQVTKVHKSVGSGMIWELPSSCSYSVALHQAVQHENWAVRISSTSVPVLEYRRLSTAVLARKYCSICQLIQDKLSYKILRVPLPPILTWVRYKTICFDGIQLTVPLFIEGRARRAEGVPNEVRSVNTDIFTTRYACNAPASSRQRVCQNSSNRKIYYQNVSWEYSYIISKAVFKLKLWFIL